MTTTIPTLAGWADGAHLGVWCRACGRVHWHGRHGPGTGCTWQALAPEAAPCTCPPGTGDGHRVAHCPPDDTSPYHDHGYAVREVGPVPAAGITADRLIPEEDPT